MGSKLRRLFSTTDAIDINAIENDTNNPAIKVYDIAGRIVYKLKGILPGKEGITCEEICLELGEKNRIGVITSQFLGLQVRGIRNGNIKWLCPRDSVNVEPGEEIFLRIRHIPTKLGCSNLIEEDVGGLRYLYYQISDDFLQENLPLDGNIAKPEGLGLVTLSLLIKLRLETEESGSTNSEDLDEFLKTVDPVSFVPKSFSKGNILKKWKLKKSICNHLKSIHATKRSSKDLMKCYLDHILGKDVLKSHFYQETFDAKWLVLDSGLADVEIQVDKGTTIPDLKLISSNRKSICPVKDLSFLEIATSLQDNGSSQYQVQIGRTTGIPEIVHFTSECDARSFLSCLESFSRLTCDYYGSLCQTVAPEWFNEMLQARVHGPSSAKYLERILEVKCRRPDQYIVYKSPSAYNTYYLCSYNSSRKIQNICIGKVERSERGYILQGANIEPTRDLKTLLRKSVIIKGLVTANSIPVRPQAEVCDTVYKLLLDCDTPRLLEEDQLEREGQKKLELQPKVYLPTDLQLQETIGRGYFTDVYRAALNEDEPVIVKSLRLSEISQQYHHHCFKALQEGMATLMTLDDPSYFVGFVGICMDMPTRMILKETEYCNLRDFLRHRDPEMILHQQHLNEATLCVANALLFMEGKKLHHGNINCSNLVVSKYDSDTLAVKLTDPGLVTLYNKMPLESAVNKNRVPWLSPRLFTDLTNTSIETDVYAYGSTVWEMFNNGWGPMDAGQQLHSWDHDTVLEFFQTGRRLLRPIFLVESTSDPDRMKRIKNQLFEMILQCWEQTEEEMILPDRIVRDLNQILGNYGKTHEYDIIPYSDDIFSSSEPLDATSGRPDQIALYQHVEKQVPDLSCLISSGQPTERKQLMQQQVQEQTTPKILYERTTPKTSFEETTPKTLEKEPVKKAVSLEETNVKTMWKAEQEPRQAATSIVPSKVSSHNVSSRPPDFPGTKRKLPPVSNVSYLIAEERLNVIHSQPLGQGHYGAVFKGELVPLSSTGSSIPIPVAVKCLKREMLERYAEDFRKEIAVMEQLQHTNIVKFYGVCKGEQYIVMEYLDAGSLYSYVVKQKQDSKHISITQFIKISLDIAKGMEYLWSKKVLHMDLACRNILLKNILLNNSVESLCAKVSDFGLSKVLSQEEDYYRRSGEKTIPVFWCALEWLGQQRFSTKCDVWSFGITMWEMCSYGKKPNICETEQQFVQQGYSELQKGKRLPRPAACSLELYQLMLDCWNGNKDLRPEFSECVTRLSQLLTAASEISDATTSTENQTSTKVVASGADDDVSRNNHKSTSLQKIGSQNSECASELSDTDDYSKMRPGKSVGDDTDNSGSMHGDHSGEVTVSEQETSLTLKSSDGITPSGDATAANKDVGCDSVALSQTGVSRTGLSSDNSRASSTGLSSVNSRVSSTVNSSKMSSFANSLSEMFLEASDVEITREWLGSGSFGKVWKGKLRENQREVAVKVCTSSEESQRFKREIQLMMISDHPNIVQFIGSIKGNGSPSKYVMELMVNGNLTTYLFKYGSNITLTTRLGFLIDIAQGMSYLSEKGILHCDLTAANILLNCDLTAKISDLGFGKRLKQDQNESEEDQYKRNNAKFKLLWSAQEVFRKHTYTRTSDVWSYGVVCLEVFLNSPEIMFKGNNSKYWEEHMLEFTDRMKAGDRFDKPNSCPEQLYVLMKQCWQWDPAERPTFNDIAESVRKLKEMVESRVCRDQT